MHYVQGQDRNQATLFPETVDEYIDEENPVRFLDVFINELDLVTLGFQYAQTKSTGRPPYNPGDLLKLYLYGYLNTIRSSRKLERECARNVELIWLLRRLKPDFKTIADFRKNNSLAIRRVCGQFTLLCKQLKLFSGQLVAIDGSKFRAVNSKKRNFTKSKLKALLANIDKKINNYMTLLDSTDKQEAGTNGSNEPGLQEKIATYKERRSTYEALLKEMDRSGQSQASLVDPDSRRMKNGIVGYNVQTAVDSKNKLIVAGDVTNEENDKKQLERMAKAAKETLEQDTLDVVADKGYYDKNKIRGCLNDKIIPYIDKPRTSSCKKKGLYSKDDFRYDKQQDCYWCPGGEKLTVEFVDNKNERIVYATAGCATCCLRRQCTTNKMGRKIYRWRDEYLLEETAQRVSLCPDIMRRRKALVEHPFGTLKRVMNQGYFLTRGLDKVRTEFSLSVLAFNLKRVLNLVDMPTLLAAAKG